MRTFVTDTIAIKKLMVENDIKTTKELSEKSGVNRNTLAKIINGKMQPTSDVMEKLILTLNINPNNAGEIFFTRNLRTA